MERRLLFAVFFILLSGCMGLAGAESLLRYFPPGAGYVTLFEAPRLVKTPLYGAMKKANWDLVKDSAGLFTETLGAAPEKTVEAVMVSGTRKRFLAFLKTGKNQPSITDFIVQQKGKIPSFTYPPNKPGKFRVYYGKVYFVPFTPYVTIATRSKGKDYLQKYMDNLDSRGRGHEPFLHELKLMAGENVFFRAAAFGGGKLFSRTPGLQMVRKVTAFASVPGGDRLYMKGSFYFDDPESARFGLQMVKQYQILLVMLMASGSEELLGKLQNAFKYQLKGKMFVAEFAPDHILTNELIAVMAKKGTDILLSGADPKNLFRMPSRRKK